MLNTTLCYIEKDESYLMLHRIKKQNDINEGKWLGVGGKFEKDESPEECAKREILEETGLNPISLEFRGIVTFVNDICDTEYMHLFTCSEYYGEIKECDEGELLFVPKNKISSLNIWEGDKIFLSLLNENVPFFSLKLIYSGDKLLKAILNGEEMI